MKSLWALVFLAMCAVLVVAFQALQQELNIRKLRRVLVFNTEDVKKMEDEILNSKAVMQKLSSQLEPLDKQKIQLTKKMEELVAQKQNAEQSLNTCQTQKTEVEQQKTERASSIDALKTSHTAETQKLQQEIQGLQKQILDRDTNICLYVDKENEKGRKLCVDKAAAMDNH